MRRIPAFLTALLLLPAAALAEDAVQPCPASLDALDQRPALGTSLTCLCKAPDASSAGDIWGTGIYTADSDICSAAVHAGALAPGNTAAVTVKALPGCGEYTGSIANGLTSSDFSSYSHSFGFEGSSMGDTSKCTLHDDSADDALPAAPAGDEPPPPPPPPQPPAGEENGEDHTQTTPDQPDAAVADESTEENPADGTEPQGLDEAAPAQQADTADGLGWAGTITAKKDYTVDLQGIQDTYHGLVTYKVSGGHYTAEAEINYVSYVPPTASNSGWVRLTTIGKGSESGDIGGPIAVITNDPMGGISLPSITVHVVKTTDGVAQDGTPVHLTEEQDISLPDVSVSMDSTSPGLPTSGNWSGTYTPEGPSNPEANAQFKPWTMTWDMNCSADCVRR